MYLRSLTGKITAMIGIVLSYMVIAGTWCIYSGSVLTFILQHTTQPSMAYAPTAVHVVFALLVPAITLTAALWLTHNILTEEFASSDITSPHYPTFYGPRRLAWWLESAYNYCAIATVNILIAVGLIITAESLLGSLLSTAASTIYHLFGLQ